MTRRAVAGAIPIALLFVTLSVGCCNENWRGTCEISGEATISGTWPSDVDAIDIRLYDHCDDEYVPISIRDGAGIDTVRAIIQQGGTVHLTWEAEEVIAGKCEVAIMWRSGATFRRYYTDLDRVSFQLKKNGSRHVSLTAVF